MAEREVIALNEDTPQLEACQSGDIYLFPRVVTMNANELRLDDDGDTSFTADTDDQIDIKIGGADDFRFIANSFVVLSGSTLDMNAQQLILDADQDTHITADTDDQIDFATGGSDRMSLYNGLEIGTVDGDPGAGALASQGVRLDDSATFMGFRPTEDMVAHQGHGMVTGNWAVGSELEVGGGAYFGDRVYAPSFGAIRVVDANGTTIHGLIPSEDA